MSHDFKDLFLLDPTITYLNFGSFGACPKPIFEKYQEWQLRLEREPVQFIVHDGIEALAGVRQSLGGFVGCDADDIVLVIKPSYAINTIAKSLKLSVGDEVLTTNLEYGACDRTWDYYCDRVGAKYVKQTIELPIHSASSFIEQFWKGYSDKTKAIFIK